MSQNPNPQSPSALADRCAAVELLVLDVDGVLTDGSIWLDARGEEIKRFHARDGSALAAWRRLGRRAAIVSGRSATAVEKRAAELGIAPVLQGVGRKGEALVALLAELGLRPDQACFVGDDLPDLPALALAGLAACPADAAREVRDACQLVTNAPGGLGAVREIVEVLLSHQGLWQAEVDSHLKG